MAIIRGASSGGPSKLTSVKNRQDDKPKSGDARPRGNRMDRSMNRPGAMAAVNTKRGGDIRDLQERRKAEKPDRTKISSKKSDVKDSGKYRDAESMKSDTMRRVKTPFSNIVDGVKGMLGLNVNDDAANAADQFNMDVDESAGLVPEMGDNDWVSKMEQDFRDSRSQYITDEQWNDSGLNEYEDEWLSYQNIMNPATVYDDLFSQLYGTQTVYDDQGNAYIVPSDKATEERNKFLLGTVYSDEQYKDVLNGFFDAGDIDGFNEFMGNTIDTVNLFDTIDDIGYQYVGNDSEAIRRLADMLIGYDSESLSLDPEGKYMMSEVYEDEEDLIDNLAAMLSDATMTSAGLDRMIDGEAEAQDVMNNLGWRLDDLNDAFNNENLEYAYAKDSQNTKDHRDNPVGTSYNDGLDEDFIKRSYGSDDKRGWGRKNGIPISTRNQADRVFALYNGLGYNDRDRIGEGGE